MVGLKCSKNIIMYITTIQFQPHCPVDLFSRLAPAWNFAKSGRSAVFTDIFVFIPSRTVPTVLPDLTTGPDFQEIWLKLGEGGRR